MMDTPRENSTHDSGVWLLDRIMNQMNAGVYITDVDTDEILFMNSGMKKQFGLVEPEGKICWQVLQKGMSERCPFCPVPRLLRDGPSAAPLRWEEHNTSNGCIYENFDSLIQWHDGRLVHFQHSLNVTEYHKLSIAATTDELTGALNRRAGKAALAEMAAACARTGEPFSLCMFDVNDLKKTNDHFGHAAGDQLLVSIAEAVRGVLQEGDVLCRLSGDEFLALMRGLGLRVAMDDFGTGYSSLSVLKHAPVDIVKIDRSFVQGLCGSAFDHSFVHLMVELCHSVGIRVCVEGVETTAELAALQPFGADYLQGFLLGHPEPAARFAPLFL